MGYQNIEIIPVRLIGTKGIPAVNPYGEIFGISGLFVADNSMIPCMSAANLTLTTVALSIRTADYFVRQYQR